ncbi:hypothetical protein F5Y11DRAFT_331399 [Daldinia sp. FL1419]|nr:hypothetical protein F5Y11DRAFT_331399 [Daldinia sp. FL1419]
MGSCGRGQGALPINFIVIFCVLFLNVRKVQVVWRGTKRKVLGKFLVSNSSITLMFFGSYFAILRSKRNQTKPNSQKRDCYKISVCHLVSLFGGS